MESLIEVLHYANAGVALLLAGVATVRAPRGGRPGRWAAAGFAALAAVLLLAELQGDAPGEWATKGILALLLALPYLLLRFAASFGGAVPWFARLAGWTTAGMLLLTVVLPEFPAEEAARPAWVWAYLLGLGAFWTALSLATIVTLWRDGRDQPTLARRRVRLMSAATAGMNVLILLAALGGAGGAGELVVQGLLLASLASFGVGLAPPRAIRLAWRQPEQAALQRATERLVEATTVSEVTDTLLPHVARIVGAPGSALWDAEGGLVASYGSTPGAAGDATMERVPLTAPFGSLTVATGPLTPFFGREELGLLHSLGALADLSLTRCLLAEREAETRAALHGAMVDAKRASTAKSDFLSRMSHELRTPLNVVLGFGQILEMRGALAERDREAVEHILKAGRHLLELINEVLDLAKIESGRMAISPEPVDLAQLAGEALDLVRPLADERSVRLTLETDGAPRFVTADRQRLKQVLLNLYSNAVKYNRHGGEVAVSCAVASGVTTRLEVRDTGPGIPATLMNRLFEPFERLGAEGGRVEGTGLGLALSRELVELMGGSIGAESEEGAGSVFWVELALAEAPATGAGARTAPAASEGTALPVRPRRVLLVEDNLANLKVVQSLLEERPSIELIPAMTGSLGITLACEHRPDLILLDQHLPDVPGVEVLHRLKAHPHSRDIPVVVVSADATKRQVERLRELGAADYLTKPLDVPRFLRVLDRLLAAEDSSG